MFKGQTYSGSSFIEFLNTDHPDLIPNFGGLDWSQVTIPHGTTVLALVYEDGAKCRGGILEMLLGQISQ